MKILLYLSVVLLLFSCTGTEPKTLKFTKENYNAKWPFSVSKIEVYCSGYSEIYCKADNGKTYALNGSAKGASHNDPSISKVEEIWLDDPDWQGLKISYGDFITQGLSLCENR
jgi:hypothetical protein